MLILIAAATGQSDRPTWVYRSTPGDRTSSSDQEASWSDYPDCIVGRLQSPIDIDTSAVTASKQLDGGIRPFLADVPMLLINTGHGYQLHETEPDHDHSWREELAFSDAMDGAYGSSHKGYTLLRGQRYNFYQVRAR